MRMWVCSHPGTEGPIEHNSTHTGTPGGPAPGCQAETPLPLTSSVNLGIQGFGLWGAVSGGQREVLTSCEDSR